MLTSLFYLFAFSIVFNLFIYAVAYFLQTDKITDLSYSLTFASMTLVGYFYLGHDGLDLLICLLILVWALRLGTFLFVRIHKMGRDDRFDQIRINPVSFFGFWVMQGLTCAVLCIPVFVIYLSEGGLSFYPYIGIAISLFGLVFETVADQQKFSFKQKFPNQFIQTGLWKHLRHPNYTGELLFWIGVFIISLPTAWWYLSILSPLWIAMILTKFSGIPPLEKKWKSRLENDEKFQAYWERSWSLFPYIY